MLHQKDVPAGRHGSRLAVKGKITSWLLVTALLFAGWGAAVVAGTRPYHEPFRPQYHFTPLKNWMNDPNGLVYYKGEYHLFFQYNPFGNKWGHMSWGHAVSRDMVHWKQLPVAIPEGNGVMIFSGSAVVDRHNSSGFCNSTSAGDSSCLVAIYAGYTGKEQNQNVAYSNDRGRTWTKYSGNPVIDLHRKNFRDPKVFWYEPGHKWVMVTVLAAEHKVRLFGSTDLKHWTMLSDFGPEGAAGGAWECPDLFDLPVGNEPGQRRWVLSVNLNPGGVAGGSGNQYFVGRFDGWKFTNDNAAGQALWADYGRDFYASTSFSDIPRSDGRRIWMGWLGNWQYAAHVPTSPWRGIQSIPRALTLKRLPQGIRLVQTPVAELTRLRGRHVAVRNQSVEAANRLLQSKGVKGDTLEIEATVDPGRATSFGFEIRKGGTQQTTMGYDRHLSELFVDRTRSGDTGFDPNFPGRQTAPLNVARGQTVEWHIFVDRCSVEVFANHGERVMSELIFPSLSSQGIRLFSSGGSAKILKLDVWNLKSAW
ncbi:MAG: glycoside hydrolase family 32 protein [Terriglobia bacterium]